MKIVDVKATGKNLERLMKENDYTVASLSKEMECHPSTIRAWLKGTRKMSTTGLFNLMKVFRLSAEDVIILK